MTASGGAGNTCFVNVALQCLRYTPHLAQSIVPDLVTLSPLPGVPPSPSPLATSSFHHPSAQHSPRLSSQGSQEQAQDLVQTGRLQPAPAGELVAGLLGGLFCIFCCCYCCSSCRPHAGLPMACICHLAGIKWLLPGKQFKHTVLGMADADNLAAITAARREGCQHS